MATGTSITIKFDYRWVIAALLIIITVMLLLWRPWEARYDRDARTVTVIGETTVKAVPDQFEFYPSYTFKNVDKITAQNEATAKSKDVTSRLKELGIGETKIKTSINTYPDYSVSGPTGETVYTLAINIIVNDKKKMQDVLEYIATTNAEGMVTPNPNFSDAKRKELESTARDQATKEARKKAEQAAKNLGFRVADVKTVNDGAGFGSSVPIYAMTGNEAGKANDAVDSFLPGENDLQYSVTVEYYIR